MATRIDVLEEADSTQDEALARVGVDPVLVIAHHQHRGRGRSGAPWQAAPRAVAASLAWHSDWPPASLPVLTLVAGLAALDVVEGSLEWPNDIHRGPDKIGGILVEGHDEVVVAGIGLNLWWPEPPEGIGAVFTTDPGRRRVESVAVGWADRLLARASAGPEAWGRDAYRSVCSTLGRDVTWEPDGAGHAVDIAEDGALVVRTAAGPTSLHSGAVHRVR